MDLTKEQLMVLVATLTERIRTLEIDNAYFRVINEDLKAKLEESKKEEK